MINLYSPGSIGEAASDFYPYTINPAVRLSILTTSPLPPGTVDVPYSLALSATGGVPAYGELDSHKRIASARNVPEQLSNLITGLITWSSHFRRNLHVYRASVRQYKRDGFQYAQPDDRPDPGYSGQRITTRSYAAGGVAPGEMMPIFGSGLGPPTLAPMVNRCAGICLHCSLAALRSF